MKADFENIQLSHIASAVPSNKVKVADYIQGFNHKEIEAISEVTGVDTLSIADLNTTSVDLALQAARAIDNTVLAEVDSVIFVSQTRDYLLPQSSFVIQKELGLPESTYCLDIPVGCTGYIYGLFQAFLLVHNHICKKVLVLTADTNSKISNLRDKATATIFGDAATATIVESGKSSSSLFLSADGNNFDKIIVPAGHGGFRNINNESKEDILREDGNYRSNCNLYMDGVGVMNFAIRKVPLIFSEFTKFKSFENADWDYLILHQANKFMIDYLRKKMKLEVSKVPVCINGYGNTGPSSIPLLLNDKFKELDIKNTKCILLCGFGVGLSWGITNVDLSNTVFYPIKNV